MLEKIRNFCIISHIDHGKSTLADRFLEITKTLPPEKIKEQTLDKMDLERERGITIKLQPVRMDYKGYILNLIDTPGHVDFSYEVSRSLAAVEGAILLIDATQGPQAQTIANLNLAKEQNLVIIPVVNKIDLPSADIEKTKEDFKKLLNCREEEIILASGKTGQGVEEILQAIIERIPCPKGDPSGPLRALIFDSFYDSYKGVVAYIRLKDGYLKKNERIKFMATGSEGQAIDLGWLKPDLFSQERLNCGEIGYVVTGLKELENVRVGDTLTLASDQERSAKTPLAGYKPPQHFVYASFYPENSDFLEFKKALLKLSLNDASLTFEEETSPILGAGFLCGFLGLLHLEIVKERLKREFGEEIIITPPSVPYKVLLKNGEEKLIKSAKNLPSPDKIQEIKEPYCNLKIVTSQQFLGRLMDFVKKRYGEFQGMEYLDRSTIVLYYKIPLAQIIGDFYDNLKSLSSGFASMDYQIEEWRASPLVKLDILIAGEKVEPFSQIVRQEEAFYVGKKILLKLKELLPKQLFKVVLQAAVGTKILCREEIPALKKDVTGHLYGGDITRKRKLWEKQKKGKKRLQKIGKINIPSDILIKIFKP